MAPRPLLARDSSFRLGWAVLLIAGGLMALNHLVLIFVLDEPLLFTGFAAFNLYALLVVWIPFRSQEKWAWWATWILPLGLGIAAAVANDPNISVFYYAVGAVCILALLVTVQHFTGKSGA